MTILLVEHLLVTIYTEQVNDHPVGCIEPLMTIYTEQENDHPVGCTPLSDYLH